MANDLVIPVGYAQCSMVWRRDSDLQPYYTTFGVSHSNEATVASDVALAVAFAFTAPQMAVKMHLDKLIARVAQEGDEPLLQEAAININGTISNNLATQNVALLWRKTTGHGGRPGRGRMYMPYADEATIDEIGNVTGAQLAAENTKASNLLSALTDTTHGAATPMVILHRHKKDGTIALPYPVTGLVCDPVAATQRRRLRR